MMKELLVAAVLLLALPAWAADYTDLRNLANDSTLRNRVEVAVMVAANDIITANPADTDERIAWAQQAIASPGPWAQRVLNLILAENKDLTVAQIEAATDAAIQTNVDATVDALAKGMTPGS